MEKSRKQEIITMDYEWNDHFLTKPARFSKGRSNSLGELYNDWTFHIRPIVGIILDVCWMGPESRIQAKPNTIIYTLSCRRGFHRLRVPGVEYHTINPKKNASRRISIFKNIKFLVPLRFNR